MAALGAIALACSGDHSPDGDEDFGAVTSPLTPPDTGAAPAAEDVPASAVALEVLSTLRKRYKPGAGLPIDAPVDPDTPVTQPAPLLPPGVAAGFESKGAGLRPRFAADPAATDHPADLVLPKRASGSAELEDLDSGIKIAFRMSGLDGVVGEVADSYVVYPKSHRASGATVLLRATPTSIEDYVSFDGPPPNAEVSYELGLTGVAGLRLVENALEFLDDGGTPRLRVARPFVIGADGTQTDATLEVDGCAVDSDPAAPWDRPVTPPGAATCRVRVSWAAEKVKYPALLDPQWSTTGAMSVARQGHTALLLPSNGKILVAGGTDGSTTFSSAELYDRTTGTWAATGSMSGARQRHTAVQLNTSSNSTTSGKILIAGGLNGSSTLNTAQLYSPSAGTWMAAGNLNAARNSHTGTLLANGRVLIAGGMNGSSVEVQGLLAQQMHSISYLKTRRAVVIRQVCLVRARLRRVHRVHLRLRASS